MATLYDSLNIEDYEIRLLCLKPGPRGSTVECVLEKKSLLDLPNYAALSYCWGDSSNVTRILVNNIAKQVTISLELALQRLRDLGVERVWADALCINQEDNEERSLQIRSMREIYSKAELTYCWLGGEDEDRAMDGLRFLRRKEFRLWFSRLRVLRADIPTQGDLARKSGNQKISVSQKIDAVIPHDHDEPPRPATVKGEAARARLPEGDHNNGCVRCKLESSFEALVDLFKREYWLRRWIIQEIAASDNAMVMCGTERLDLEELYGNLKQCQRTPFWNPSNKSTCVVFETVISLRRRYQADGGCPLAQAILLTRDFRSRDPRDKIFSLIGICPDGPRLVPTPNYRQSPESISMELTRSIIKSYQCFDFVLGSQRRRDGPSSLPSWVVDWVSHPVLSNVPHSNRIRRDTITSTFRGYADTLMMRGLSLGNVVGVTTSISANLGGESSSHTSMTTNTNQNLKNSQLYYQTQQGVRDALTWCLVGDEPNDITHLWFKYHSTIKTYRRILDKCNRISTSVRRNSDEETGIMELKFHRWATMNSDFRIDGECLQTWLRVIGNDKGVKLSLLRIYHFIISHFTSPALLFCIFLFGEVIFVTITMSVQHRYIRPSHPGFIAVHALMGILFCTSCWFRCWPRARVSEDGIAPNHRHWRNRHFHGSQRIEHPLESVMRKERLALCDTGMLAMVGDDTKPGDQLCRLHGFKTFVVLRKIQGQEENGYELIGKAFPCLSEEEFSKCPSVWSKLEPDDSVQVDWKEFTIK